MSGHGTSLAAPPASILTVDDSPTLRSLIRDVLQGHGYHVLAAGSGEEALSQLDREAVDIVLADVIMPTMDGYELCRRIKDLDPTSPIPVILLTSKGDLNAKVTGFEAGADDYIIKPFKPEELLMRVRAQLRLKVLQEELAEKNRRLLSTSEQLETRVTELEAAYKEITLYQDRTSRAIELASRVQRALLPRSAPEIPGYDIAYMYEPAESIAGDFFDFLPLPGGRTGIAIGDVAGKGVGASLLMVLAMSALRQAAERDDSPRDVLERVNEIIRRQYDAGEMITLFYGILNPSRGTLRYASAGHEPGLLALAGGGVRRLGAGGPFLGIFPHITMSEEEVVLCQGDRLLLLTDGVLDRFTARSGTEGTEQLIRLLSEERNRISDVWLSLLPRTPPVGGEQDDTTAVLMEVQRGAVDEYLGDIVLEASPASFREVRATSEGIATRLGLRGRPGFEFVYAVDEAVGHFIQHAPRSRGAVFVRVEYRLTERRNLTVSIDGKGIEVPRPDLDAVRIDDPHDLTRLENWSLFLVKQMSCEVRFEDLEESGTRLSFEVPLRDRAARAKSGD